ncbi:MAG: hypothetical protein IPM85_04855 [Chitinophagaceae bacterium]|nr:hypothetical protein [Chitinophagaceae bacterium]
MNSAQIHLALNHAPLFLSATGGLILILGYIRKNEDFKRLSCYFLIAASLFTIPVFVTGEGTEELVEHLPGVNEAAIEKHEDMAKISMVIIALTGVVALAGLFLRKNNILRKFIIAGAVFLSLASFGTMAQTAHLGGLIRHAELGNGSQKNPQEVKKKKIMGRRIMKGMMKISRLKTA